MPRTLQHFVSESHRSLVPALNNAFVGTYSSIFFFLFTSSLEGWACLPGGEGMFGLDTEKGSG